MIPPNELALKVTGEWTEERLEPGSEVTPRNPRAYAQFKSATVYSKGDVASVEEDVKMPRETEMNALASSMKDSAFNDGRFVTKTTVHCLYREITGLVESYEDLSQNMTTQLIIEEHDLEQECEEFPMEVDTDHLEASIRGFFQRSVPQAYAEAYFEIQLANRVLPFLTLAQVVIEDYSVSLLHDKVIDEDYRGSNTTKRKLERKLSQPGREMLLQRTGLVSGDLRSDMQDVRQTRNDLVHNLRETDYFEEVVEAAEAVETCAEVIEKFEERYDEGRFSW
jgi:hypothetical protein